MITAQVNQPHIVIVLVQTISSRPYSGVDGMVNLEDLDRYIDAEHADSLGIPTFRRLATRGL